MEKEFFFGGLTKFLDLKLNDQKTSTSDNGFILKKINRNQTRKWGKNPVSLFGKLQLKSFGPPKNQNFIYPDFILIYPNFLQVK